MNIEELQKILRNSTEENIDFDEPHITLMCEENNLTKEKIIHILLYETEKLSHFIEDRPKVYKLYFKLSARRQLKLVIDIFNPRKIMIRTIKILDRKLYKNIKVIKKRGFR